MINQNQSTLTPLTARYIVLNPVRAGMVQFAEEWKWSSYRETINQAPLSLWLSTDWILAGFVQTKGVAIKAYKRFVLEGAGQTSPWLNLKNQVFLGSDVFVARISQQIDDSKDLRDIPASQRRSIPKPLKHYGDTIQNLTQQLHALIKAVVTL